MFIDVKQAVFVPESCATDTSNSACQPCTASYNCDVNNKDLQMNTGLYFDSDNNRVNTTTINFPNGMLHVKANLGQKTMRVRFATLATEILRKENGKIKGSAHECNSDVVEKAENFLKLA